MSDLAEIDVVAGIPIYSVKGDPKSFLFKAGMMIDCDGSPRAYGPEDSGIDYTANGGNDEGGGSAAWWGGPVDSNGYPVKQAIYDPYPGMYVSGTALINPLYDEDSPYRYSDAESIPFIVLPGKHNNGAKLGDVCFCYNTKTEDNCYGIYADIGPSGKLGEASMRMASALKINNDPKHGGTESQVIAYLVFPGSVGKWSPPAQWFQLADKLFSQWGGFTRLKGLLDELVSK